MNPEALYQRYQELRTYVGWTEMDREAVVKLAPLVIPYLASLVDDFYAEISRHPNAMKVITGGDAQIARLKGTLLSWLRDLFQGNYDEAYVYRRWRVGMRHVEIGLDQVYTNAALSRLRRGLLHYIEENGAGSEFDLHQASRSLNLLLDLDLAIIEDAYQSEYFGRHQRIERLAAIGQVAGGVAHELRNPLNVVKTSVYYLLHAQNLVPEKRIEHLERIERHVVLADGVITALSNFARLPVPSNAKFSVHSCLQEAIDTNPLPDHVKVQIVPESGNIEVHADKDQLRIVFANLIRNAREAMPSGGNLQMIIRPKESLVEVDIIDDGMGIPPDRLAHVMEPLYSTKAKGLGLGLAIARAILEKNQGSLRVASIPGKGSTFTVTLQRAGNS